MKTRLITIAAVALLYAPPPAAAQLLDAALDGNRVSRSQLYLDSCDSYAIGQFSFTATNLAAAGSDDVQPTGTELPIVFRLDFAATTVYTGYDPVTNQLHYWADDGQYSTRDLEMDNGLGTLTQLDVTGTLQDNQGRPYYVQTVQLTSGDDSTQDLYIMILDDQSACRYSMNGCDRPRLAVTARATEERPSAMVNFTDITVNVTTVEGCPIERSSVIAHLLGRERHPDADRGGDAVIDSADLI